MAKSLRQQLRKAFDESGLTMTELRERSGLDIDESSLGRKLNGHQSLRADECEAIACALKVKVTIGREARSS